MTTIEDSELTEDQQQKLTELQTQHGQRLAVFNTEEGLVVFKKPRAADYDRFAQKVSAGQGSRPAAARELCLSCVVHPQRDELLRVFDELPGLPTAVTGELLELVGATAEAMGKGQRSSTTRRNAT